MKTTLKEQQSPWTLAVTVSLDEGDLSGHFSAARKELAKELAVEGFRKGKAPDDVASSQLSDEKVRQAALQIALEKSFSDVVRQQNWDIARTEELQVLKNTLEELTYSVMVCLWPQVDLGGVAEVTVARKEVLVGQEQMEEALDTLRNMRASFLEKEGPIAQGDRVELDFRATRNGVAVPGAEGNAHPLIVGGKTFLPGFEEELVGLRTGDRKEFDLKAPDDYPYREIAGATLHFEVTVSKVQLVMRPEINDAFAKELKYENTEALREAIQQSVQAQERTRERDRIRLAIMEAIITKAELPTPDFMVTEETDRIIGRFEQDLQSKGLGLELYLSRLGKTRDDLVSQWQGEAQRQVRMSLIIRQVIKDQRLTADTEEVEQTFRDTLGKLSGQEGFNEQEIDAEALRRTVADRIVTEKAFAYLERTHVA